MNYINKTITSVVPTCIMLVARTIHCTSMDKELPTIDQLFNLTDVSIVSSLLLGGDKTTVSLQVPGTMPFQQGEVYG